jgi:hypothetical protein
LLAWSRARLHHCTALAALQTTVPGLAVALANCPTCKVCPLPVSLLPAKTNVCICLGRARLPVSLLPAKTNVCICLGRARCCARRVGAAQFLSTRCAVLCCLRCCVPGTQPVQCTQEHMCMYARPQRMPLTPFFELWPLLSPVVGQPGCLHTHKPLSAPAASGWAVSCCICTPVCVLSVCLCLRAAPLLWCLWA